MSWAASKAVGLMVSPEDMSCSAWRSDLNPGKFYDTASGAGHRLQSPAWPLKSTDDKTLSSAPQSSRHFSSRCPQRPAGLVAKMGGCFASE
jgi:hypothetical protein